MRKIPYGYFFRMTFVKSHGFHINPQSIRVILSTRGAGGFSYLWIYFVFVLSYILVFSVTWDQNQGMVNSPLKLFRFPAGGMWAEG